MVQKAGMEDAKTVAALALSMWEADSAEEMEEEFREILAGGEAAVFLKMEGEEAVGFAQCQLRHDYVEGTKTSPVGYLEGIYIKESCRRKGYARELLGACEQWAHGQGCTEFASDCELDNEDSFRFHMQMGFLEANRVICFTKKLCPEKQEGR